MKYLKIIGLAAVAAMAMSAFASSASATELYSGGVTQKAGTAIKAQLATGTSAALTTTEGTLLNTCTASTLSGTTSNTGSATETVKGTVTAANLTFTGCKEEVKTLEGGTLEVHYTSGIDGTITGIGFKITVKTPFGSCVFTAGAGTTLGTLTGSTTGNATMDINAVVTRESGLCPSSAKWVGTYTVTAPTKLEVRAS